MFCGLGPPQSKILATPMVPQKFVNESKNYRKKLGRPKNEDQEQAFLKSCAYLETNDEDSRSFQP